MSGPHKPIADAVVDNLAGQRRADAVLEELTRGTSHPDRLHDVALKVWADHGTLGLQGFLRRMSKAIERSIDA